MPVVSFWSAKNLGITQMNKTYLAAAVYGLLAIGGEASAVQYSWNLNSSASNSHTMTFGSTPSGQTLTVSAFRSGNTFNSGSEVGTGNLIDAYVNPDGSFGLGVFNSGESSPDDRYLDNRSGVEVLVFDAGVGMDNFDWGSIKLGHILSGTDIDSTPNLTYWTGGNGGVTDAQFNNLCLKSTSSNSCTSLQTSSYGFTAHTPLTISTAGTAQALGPNTIGRYLVVSGALDANGTGSGGYDKFKISTVPTPQTISLVGIGFLAMFFMQRRRAAGKSERDSRFREA